MKIKYITPIEYNGDKWYLSIGNKAPWINDIQIPVSVKIARLFL